MLSRPSIKNGGNDDHHTLRVEKLRNEQVTRPVLDPGAPVRAVLHELSLLPRTLSSIVPGKELRFPLTLSPGRAGSEMEACAQVRLRGNRSGRPENPRGCLQAWADSQPLVPHLLKMSLLEKSPLQQSGLWKHLTSKGRGEYPP